MRDAPHRPVELDQVWIRIRRRAAIPDVRIHDLRHSFASVAIQDGVPLHVIGKLLGHALPETTARYAHLADEVIADAADRVCGGLASALGLAA
jgi:integrase